MAKQFLRHPAFKSWEWTTPSARLTANNRGNIFTSLTDPYSLLASSTIFWSWSSTSVPNTLTKTLLMLSPSPTNQFVKSRNESLTVGVFHCMGTWHRSFKVYFKPSSLLEMARVLSSASLENQYACTPVAHLGWWLAFCPLGLSGIVVHRHDRWPSDTTSGSWLHLSCIRVESAVCRAILKSFANCTKSQLLLKASARLCRSTITIWLYWQ